MTSKKPSTDHEAIEIPERLAILPLRDMVLFPGSTLPIDVGRNASLRLVEKAIEEKWSVIGVVAQRSAKTERPTEADLYTVGTAARLLKVIKIEKNHYSVILQGLCRVQMLAYTQQEPFFTCNVRQLVEQTEHDIELDALMLNLKALATEVLQRVPDAPRDIAGLIDTTAESARLGDLITSLLDLPVAEQQKMLETLDVKERLRESLLLLTKQGEVHKLRGEIDAQVQATLSSTQHEYILRQRLRAIHQELGEMNAGDTEFEEIEQRIAEAQLPAEVLKVAQRQFKRLKQMQTASPEYTVAQTYLEWLVDLPWVTTTEDNLDIDHVRQILDDDHYNLDKVKRRIVEYLAVRKLKPDKRGPILCLVGPPGVGKTSLGRSIARAIGRKFIRVSLGGVRDEAEIRGHRRTYVGSLPGRIIQSIKRAGTINPVFILDEIDKLGHDFRGDPASALLEVLDPEQNDSFSDHYLEVPYDLSRVMFIATANLLDPVPPALRDRLEVIELPGYTQQEKLAISRRFLLPKQIEGHGLSTERLSFSDDAVTEIISGYTREAGVRNLEREIANVVRGCAVTVAEDPSRASDSVTIEADAVSGYLGAQKHLPGMAEREAEAGVVTGLAWTPVGGEILFVEATRMLGKGKLMLTGQLGDVMKESAQAALSIVRTRASTLGIDPHFLDKQDLHLHIPGGAIPKDGPSAGLAMTIALASLFKEVGVAPTIALTGEITLRGRVLPVGGVKEKVLAAHRAGIKTVILPERNEKDMVDIPDQARDELQFHFVNHVDQVWSILP